MTKTLLHASSMASMEQAVGGRGPLPGPQLLDPGHPEALAAFAEKREPLYIGR